MNGARPVTLQGWIAAGLLAILTIFVFTTLRDQGPANAVRRFHLAILHGDRRDFDAVVVPPADPVAAEVASRLAAGVSALYARGIREASDYPAVRKQGRFAQVLVRYEFPDGRIDTLLWVVRQTPPSGAWKVDPVQTLLIRERAMGLGGRRLK